MSSIRTDDAIINKMIEETHINPTLIYCQFTGAIIGKLSSLEIQLLFDSFDENISDDEIIDELYVRTLASMRPSPAWNKLSRESIERLRQINPSRVCAYLLGRYYQSRDKAYTNHVRTLDEILRDGFNRIIVSEKLEQADTNSEAFKQFLSFLLLIDSHFNITAIDSLDLPSNPLDIDFSNLESLAGKITNNYQWLVERKAKLERQAKLHESELSSIGNKLVRVAAHKSFMEIKPKSDASISRAEKRQFETMVANLLGAIMDGDKAFTPIKLKPIVKTKPLGPIRLKIKGINQ